MAGEQQKPTEADAGQTPPTEATAKPTEVSKPTKAPVAKKPKKPKAEKKLVGQLEQASKKPRRRRYTPKPGAVDQVEHALKGVQTLGDALELLNIWDEYDWDDALLEFLPEHAETMGWKFDEDKGTATRVVDGVEEEVTEDTPFSGDDIRRLGLFDELVKKAPGLPEVEKETLDLVVVVENPGDPWWRLYTAWNLDFDDRIGRGLEAMKTVGDAMETFSCYYKLSDFLEEYAEDLGWKYSKRKRIATRVVDGREEEVTLATPITGDEIEATSAFGAMMERLCESVDAGEGNTLSEVMPDPSRVRRVRGFLKRADHSSPGGGGPDEVYYVRGEEGLAALQAVLDDPMFNCPYKVVFKRA